MRVAAIAIWACLLGARTALAGPSDVAEAHVTKNGNVVLTYEDGRRLSLTKQGNYDEVVEVAKDKRTVAWTRTTDSQSTVFIYRNGSVKRIQGDPFVRGVWFVDGGKKIGIDSGGLHFAGVEYLYDVETLKELGEVKQWITPTSERPSWSRTSDKFSEE